MLCGKIILVKRNDLFRLLGKLLYNKRYVKNKNAIQKLKKEEFGNNYETPRYYDINELINEIPISNHSFNELLIYNSLDHFNDMGEYADISDLYSFSDTIDNFDAFLYDKNNHYFYNNSYMRTYLNCLGVTSYNLSQYNSGKKYKFNPFIEKGLMTIKKPDIKIINGKKYKKKMRKKKLKKKMMTNFKRQKNQKKKKMKLKLKKILLKLIKKIIIIKNLR